MLTQHLNEVLERKRSDDDRRYHPFKNWRGPYEIPSLDDVASFIGKHFPGGFTVLDEALRSFESFRA